MPANADAETQLNDLLNADTSVSSITEVFKVDESVREALASLPSLESYAAGKLMEFVEQSDLVRMARLMDVFIESSEPDHTKLFFTLLEWSLSSLTLAQCEQIWPFLEARHHEIAKLAEGANSIALLRTCRSYLSRLHPVLDSSQSGKVLQFLAVTKGFGHPSRLNKRGKVGTTTSNLPNLDGSVITPLEASQVLQDLSRLSPEDTETFLVRLLKRTNKKFAERVDNVKSANFEFDGWEFRDRVPVAGFRLLAEQMLIALSAIAARTKEDESLASLISKLTSNAERILDPNYKKKLARVFASERHWREWKDAGCPYIDSPEPQLVVADVEGMPLALMNVETLPQLNGHVGNDRLSRLLKLGYNISQFEHVQTRASPATGQTKHESEVADFIARRLTPWSQLVEDQAKDPVNLHEELKQEEAELQDPHTMATKRSNSTSTSEPVHKRPRISYEEDTRYQDRQRGMQSTARPLPY